MWLLGCMMRIAECIINRGNQAQWSTSEQHGCTTYKKVRDRRTKKKYLQVQGGDWNDGY